MLRFSFVNRQTKICYVGRLCCLSESALKYSKPCVLKHVDHTSDEEQTHSFLSKKAPRRPHTVRIYGVDCDEPSLLSLATPCVFLLFITNVEGRAISRSLVMSLLSHV